MSQHKNTEMRLYKNIEMRLYVSLEEKVGRSQSAIDFFLHASLHPGYILF